MDRDEAMGRVPVRNLPGYWVGSVERAAEVLARVRQGHVTTLAITPGGRPIPLVTYGAHEPVAAAANFNSAVGGRDASAYMDKASRRKPVVLLVGPVHGHEVEGLTGLANLISVLETGSDLGGQRRERLAELAAAVRLLIVPMGNPDGLARFAPQSLQGMLRDDIRYWGQGTWRDGTFCSYPQCKRRHPMAGADLGFLGCYFNDAGINPMHDEFFAPMGPESRAILDLARHEGPDFALLLHSYELASGFLATSWVPADVTKSVREIAEATYRRFAERDVPCATLASLTTEAHSEPEPFNLASAVYHTSGAVSAVFECSHGTLDVCAAEFEDILETQLALYETVLEYALARKEAEQQARAER